MGKITWMCKSSIPNHDFLKRFSCVCILDGNTAVNTNVLRVLLNQYNEINNKCKNNYGKE